MMTLLISLTVYCRKIMPPIFQTLQRMRDYEKKLAEKEKKVNSTKSETREATGTNTDRCSSSAMDQGSEASATSDVPVSLVGALSRENLSLGFTSRSDTNLAVQLPEVEISYLRSRGIALS